MGTRGAYGFRKNGVDKVSYNHFDSYPDYLGENLVAFVREHSLEELSLLFDEIQMVDYKIPPTEEQKQKAKELGLYNDMVSTRSDDDWYCLLRESQGNLYAIKDIKLMIDDQHFLAESLFCEWAYLIDLDTNEFVVFRGFQKEPHQGRYGHLEPVNSGYYAVREVAAFPLDNIPDDWKSNFIEEEGESA